MNVAVIGTGYVGLVTAACLAEIGHSVIGMDDVPSKVATLQAGGLPIYEPYLAELVTRNMVSGRLSFTDDVAVSVRNATVIFICVNTPPLPSGEADLSYVENATRRIASIANGYACIVQKSTVPVRTGQWLERTMNIYSEYPEAEYDVASNPEFTREGMAVEDFLHPDRIVLGVKTDRAERVLRELYAPIVEGRFECPIHRECSAGQGIQVQVTDLSSAELIKHASNSFLAMKISYANMLADLCEVVGADIRQVVKGIGSDKRIGSSFLNAGIGYGGSCFPKDLKAFVNIAEKHGVDFSLLREAERINEARVEMVLQKLRKALWNLKGKRIGLLGLAFKPGTDDIRSAPALVIAKRLLADGATVVGTDPHATRVAEEVPGLSIVKDAYEVARGAEALILCTEWPQFRELDWAKIKTRMMHPFILDGRNALDCESLRASGFEVVGIGI